MKLAALLLAVLAQEPPPPCVLGPGALAGFGAQDDSKGFLGLHEADMSIGPADGSWSLLISGILDFEHYEFQEDPPGLLFYKKDDGYTSNPRGTLFFDLNVGERLFAFMQARGDRGFDPNYMGMMDIYHMRIDELFVRYTFHQGEDSSADVQVGKFATPLGNFVPRHDSMKNPFVRAPIAYDHVTTIGDNAIGPKTPLPSNQALINRRDIDDLKDRWVTPIWGPVYHHGIMVFGALGKFDARVAWVNAAPSERPLEWDKQRLDFDVYNFSGRIGWNPFIGLRAGLNFSHGPYLSERVEDVGTDQDRFDQTLLGLDLEYSIGHLQLFAEIWWSRWEVPNVTDDPVAITWYIEGRYKLSGILPGLYVCARVGQIFASEIDRPSGGDATWERTSWRAELGAGWFFYVNLLLKAQYEVNHTNGPNDPRDNMASFSLSLSF